MPNHKDSTATCAMLLRTFRPLAHCVTVSLRRLAYKKYVVHQIHSPQMLGITLQCCRLLSTPPPMVIESKLSMEGYHAVADKTMEDLLAALEDLVESRGEADQEVDYHSGVLTLDLGRSGTYVINKQPPNKQIWLSSPISGPKRYDFREDTKTWIYSRDNKTLDELLSEELSAILGGPIKISL